MNDLVTGCCTSRLFVKGSHFCCMKTLPIWKVIIHVFTGDVRGSKNSPKCPVMCQNGFCTIHRGDTFVMYCPVILVNPRSNSDLKSGHLWWIAHGMWNGLAAAFHVAAVNTSDFRSELSHARVQLCEVSHQWSAKRFVIV